MSEAVTAIDTREVETEIAPVVQRADALIVRNVDEHRTALGMLGAVMVAERKVKQFFAPMLEAAQEGKRKAEATRQAIVLRQDEVLAPILAARETITERAGAFELEEKAAAEKIQEQLRREAQAKQDAQRELDAAMADTEEAAEDALTEPLAPPPVPVVRPEVAKVAGVSGRTTWSAKVTDKAAFLAWAAKPENNFYAEANVVALNSRARAEKKALSIPGVEAVESFTYAGR